MAHKMAHITYQTLDGEVSNLYNYYTELSNRGLLPEEGANVVYEEEFEKLNKMYDSVFHAATHMVAYTKNHIDRFNDLFDGLLTDVRLLMEELESSRLPN